MPLICRTFLGYCPNGYIIHQNDQSKYILEFGFRKLEVGGWPQRNQADKVSDAFTCIFNSFVVRISSLF